MLASAVVPERIKQCFSDSLQTERCLCVYVSSAAHRTGTVSIIQSAFEQRLSSLTGFSILKDVITCFSGCISCWFLQRTSREILRSLHY